MSHADDIDWRDWSATALIAISILSLILAAVLVLFMLIGSAHAQPAGPTRESVAIQVLQSQRNGALDAVVGCTADAEIRRVELQARIDELTKQLAEAKGKSDAR
jgi:hypothetical protein